MLQYYTKPSPPFLAGRRYQDTSLMHTLAWPSTAEVRKFLASQMGAPLTYSTVGATATGDYPSGFDVDHRRTEIGLGDDCFRRACEAIRNWRQFDLGWVRATPTDTPLAAEALVAVSAKFGGVCTTNAARIVYVVDEPQRFGFAYGTLPRHVEQGEERFLVELVDGRVYYDILAFSRPRHLLARLGYPLMRRLQKRFGRDSAAAMRRAVGSLTRA
jgi:uncharacterized protein (UPF0548 family)